MAKTGYTARQTIDKCKEELEKARQPGKKNFIFPEDTGMCLSIPDYYYNCIGSAMMASAEDVPYGIEILKDLMAAPNLSESKALQALLEVIGFYSRDPQNNELVGACVDAMATAKNKATLVERLECAVNANISTPSFD